MSEETQDVTVDELKAQLEAINNEKTKLLAKNEELLSEKKAAQKKAQEEADARQQAADEAAKKNGDFDALEKSWTEKLAKRESELAEQLKQRDAKLIDLTVNQTARKIAADLALPGKSDVLLPFIQSRLAYVDGKTVVLSPDGKPSASTVEELAKEIGNDPRFDVLIAANLASGGGANGSNGGGATNKGDLGGDKASRVAAIKSKFPELNH